MKKKQIVILLCIMASILGCISCSFQSNKITNPMLINDISADTTYADIVTLGYMGGSLIYNESDRTLGHLVDGVSVAVRLSNAQRYDVSDSESVFQEKEDSVIYGLLVVNKISVDEIALKSILYDITGNIFLEKNFVLKKNSFVDLNNDGFADLGYSAPSVKRSGYEKAMYLNFLSSQEDLNITMFSVLPEQYLGQTYPNGIIGVNNDDKFIVQKYVNVDTNQRSVISGVYKGDYIVDNKNNKYQCVINNHYARNARSVSDDDLVDLNDEIDLDNTIFLFTEEDFAFSSPDSFLNALPACLVNDYLEFKGIEKLNKLLENKELIKIIDEEQGSIIPENEKLETFNQFDFLTNDEIIQINRVFLEQNYPSICPQRVTVSTVITEVLPLSSIVFAEINLSENNIEEKNNRAVYKDASFLMAETEQEYKEKLKSLEKEFDTYKIIKTYENFNIPVYKDNTVNSNLTLNDSIIAMGIKGKFTSTFGSIKSSLSAAAFFRINADIGVHIQKNHVNDNYTADYSGTKTDEEKYQNVKTLPLVKKDITLYEFELCQKTNLATVAIGPILIGVNLDLGVGLPIKTKFEMDCEVAYSAYLAGLAKASVSVGVDYGITWKKKFLIKLPHVYINWNKNATATADAIFYVDQNFESLDFNLTKLAFQFSLEPYIKSGMSVSIASVVHAGYGLNFGAKGYVNFGYYQPCIKGSYGLNDTSSIFANAFLGLKGIKFLGINIGNIGREFTWTLRESENIIIPETTFFEYKLK